MCVPAAAVGIGLALTVLSTGAAIYQQQQQAQALEDQANFEEQRNRQNQALLNRIADDTIKRGEAAQNRHSLNVQRQIIRARQAAAGSGIAVFEDTSLANEIEITELGGQDIAAIGANAQREAFGQRQQAVNFGNQAIFARAEGQAASRAGNIATFGAILGGASSIAGTAAAFSDNTGSNITGGFTRPRRNNVSYHRFFTGFDA